MCRSTAAPLMAMVGMAGTAVGIGIAVLKEKADRRAFKREAEAELAALDEEIEKSTAPVDEEPEVAELEAPKSDKDEPERRDD